MKKENECLTYQEEIISFYGRINEIYDNELMIVDELKNLKNISRFHDIMLIVIMIILMIIFIFWR